MLETSCDALCVWPFLPVCRPILRLSLLADVVQPVYSCRDCREQEDEAKRLQPRDMAGPQRRSSLDVRPCLQDGVSEDALLTVYSAMRIVEYDAAVYHVDALDFGSDQHSWLMYGWASCCAAASACSCTRTKHGSPCTSLCWQRSPVTPDGQMYSAGAQRV